MDSRLAQRLVGAAVVVALAVIFIPELVQDKPQPTTTATPESRPPSLRPKPPQPSLTLSLIHISEPTRPY